MPPITRSKTLENGPELAVALIKANKILHNESIPAISSFVLGKVQSRLPGYSQQQAVDKFKNERRKLRKIGPELYFSQFHGRLGRESIAAFCSRADIDQTVVENRTPQIMVNIALAPLEKDISRYFIEGLSFDFVVTHAAATSVDGVSREGFVYRTKTIRPFPIDFSGLAQTSELVKIDLRNCSFYLIADRLLIGFVIINSFLAAGVADAIVKRVEDSGLETAIISNITLPRRKFNVKSFHGDLPKLYSTTGVQSHFEGDETLTFISLNVCEIVS